MEPEFITEENLATLRASKDFQNYIEIAHILNAPGTLDLATGIHALESSYDVSDPGRLTYQLHNLDPQIAAGHPRPNVAGIGPVTEFSKGNGQLSILTFVGKASIDDDGTGPSHGDPSHQALPGNKNINADVIPYAVISQSLLVQVGGGSIQQGLREIPYDSVLLVERNGHVFPAVVEDAGPYHSTGEVSVRLSQQIGNFSHFGANGPVDLSATDVKYYYFAAGTNVSVNGPITEAHIAEQARAALSDRLQQRADELFQRALSVF